MGRVYYTRRPILLSGGIPKELGYVALTPSNLTAEQGYGGPLEYSRLSDSLNSAYVTEILNSYQGSIHAWVKPAWNSGSPRTHYVCDFGNIELYWDGANTQWKATVNGVNIARTDSFSAGGWVYLLLTWDSAAPTLDLVADSTSAVQVTSAQTNAAPGSTIYLGSDSSSENEFTSPIAIRVADIIEATLYDSGDGDTDMFVVSSGSVAFLFSDDDTGMMYANKGKGATAAVDGANDTTVTTDAGSDTVFVDGEAVLLEDGCGGKGQGFVDGTPSSTSVVVDDGAGALVSGLSAVGVFAGLSGSSRYFSRSDADFPESGITGATDFTIQMWIKPDSVSGVADLVMKAHVGSDKFMYGLYKINASLRTRGSADGTFGNATQGDSSAVLTATWQHIAVVYDASAGTVDFYRDGVFINQDTGLQTSIADKDPAFTIGAGSDYATYLAGDIAEVRLYDDKRTAAEILASATDLSEDASAHGNIVGQWKFNLAAAVTQIDNTQGDAGRDLDLVGGTTTNYGTHTRTRDAHLSKNLLADGGMEGPMGAWTIVGTPATNDKESDTDQGTQSLHWVADAADEGYSQAISASNGDKFYLYQRHKVTSGSFGVAVTNGGGDIETGIADAGWTALEKIISATDNLTFAWHSEASGDDVNISTATINKCIAGDSLTAGKYYTLVYNVDTTTTGAAWSGLGSDATEVKAGDLYIPLDTAASTGP